MNNEYYPDGWHIIKNKTDNEITYFIFASCSGGYLHGDSWRRNSGIVKVEEHKEGKIHDFKFHGHTGSVYVCAKHSEGRISGYAMGVLNQILDQNDAEIISLEDFLKEFNDV